jgi:hypothetical protein
MPVYMMTGVPSDIVATAQDKSKTIFFFYYCKTVQRPVELGHEEKKSSLIGCQEESPPKDYTCTRPACMSTRWMPIPLEDSVHVSSLM